MLAWKVHWIYIVISCRYTNYDYGIRTYRTYRLVISERCMCYATETNCVSPKIFGSCFWLRGRIVCAYIIPCQTKECNVCLILLRMNSVLFIFRMG
jgi:hypothetical protein